MASSPECVLVALVLACSTRGGNGFRGPAAGTNEGAFNMIGIFTSYSII